MPHTNKKAGKIIPCKKFFGDDQESKPGFKYGGTDTVDSWEWPCFPYDPLNESSKKQAMKRAIESGQEFIDELEKKVREEMAQKEFEDSVKQKKDA